MAIYSTVACAEEHGSQISNRTLDNWTAQVKVRCDWDDRLALEADVLGNRRQWPHAANGPTAQGIAIVPVPTKSTTVGQSIEYMDALVTINYGMDQKDLISESLEPTAEFIKLDHKRFRWGGPDGDVLLEGEAPGKLVRGLNLVRTLYEVTGALSTDLLDLVGSCNSAQYTSSLLGLTFNEETLLYQPPTLNRTITTAGTDGWNLTLKFSYKKETWNKFWRHKTQTYSKIYVLGAGEYESYPPEDFSAFLS